MTYRLEFTRAAGKQLEDIMKVANASERQHFRNAFDELQSNPYPSNPRLRHGVIERLRVAGDWRFKVSRKYRLRYTVKGRTVTVHKILHRKDIYRDP